MGSKSIFSKKAPEAFLEIMKEQLHGSLDITSFENQYFSNNCQLLKNHIHLYNTTVPTFH